MTQHKSLIALLAVGVLVSFAFLLASSYANIAGASTFSEASDYQATSTAASGIFGAQTLGVNRLIKTGQGSFGSVIITGANTGVVNFYNATTTNILLRTNNTPTSTILLASLPASLAAGTYTFDIGYTTGLVVELFSGSFPTSTITWR